MEGLNLSKVIAAVALGAATVTPALAPAQDLKKMLTPPKSRQGNKNLWRNLGIAGGAAGVLGLLNGNKTLAALGIGGGLYSAYRYEQDRKSQSKENRQRYELFRHTSFDHDGHHYVRHTRIKNGQKYYYFKRTR